MIVISIAVIWFTFSIMGYGISFAHFQKAYPFLASQDYGTDMAMSLFFGIIGGPIFFFVFRMLENFEGFKFY